MAAAMRVEVRRTFLAVPMSAARWSRNVRDWPPPVRRAGLIGAWFVATSPVVVYMMMVPMTDVPVAAAWATALFFVLGTSWRSAGAAGLAAAAAVLIRPNLAPLAGVLAIAYVLRPSTIAQARRARIAQRLGKAAVYCAGAAGGVAATMLINRRLYGSPFVSAMATSAVAQLAKRCNLRLWRLAARRATPLVLQAAAVFVPRRAWWPEVRQRVVVVAACSSCDVRLYACCNSSSGRMRFLLPTAAGDDRHGRVCVVGRAWRTSRPAFAMPARFCISALHARAAPSRRVRRVEERQASVVIASAWET